MYIRSLTQIMVKVQKLHLESGQGADKCHDKVAHPIPEDVCTRAHLILELVGNHEALGL